MAFLGTVTRRLTPVLLSGAGILLLAQSAAGSDLEAHAELIVLNGDIMTMSAQQADASALAVADGVIIGVGSDNEMRLIAGPETVVFDAEGRFISPGFIDTHLHPQPLFDEFGPFGRLDLSPEGGVTSRQDMFEKLRAKAGVTPAGQLILGQNYSENQIGGHPTARELDAVILDHPVILVHSSGHRRAVNSMALQMADIDDDTPNPDGGEIDRDASGHATGIILENVPGFGPVYATMPRPKDAQRLEGYRKQFSGYLAQGITGIGAASTSPSQLADFRSLLRDGMPMHINAMVLHRYLDWVSANRFKDEWAVRGLTMNTIKVFHGNSLSGQTAWLYEPYASDPNYFGIAPHRSQADINALVEAIHDAGLQLAIHSNGDREIDMVLTAIEAAQAANPRPAARHRIEHASVVNPGILERIKADNVGLAPHSYVLNHGEKMEAFGAARWDMMHPNRSAIDMGIPVGGNSDSPVSPAQVMQRIQSMVTRRARSNGKVYGARQRVTVEQALNIWTRGSAYLQFDDERYGSIEIGKRADFVVLSEDPREVPEENIGEIEVLYNFISGEIAYENRLLTER